MSRFVIALLLLSGAASVQAQEIRVRLFEGRSGSTARFTAQDAPLSVSVDGTSIATLLPGETVRMERDADEVRVSTDGVQRTGSRVEVRSEGVMRLRAGRYERSYRGGIEVARSSRGLRLVNRVDVEPYVASVVASEYPFREIEGVKAQTILARTYALRHRGAHAEWDVDDTQRSQVYKGEGTVTATSREAAMQTAGLVLRYGSGLAETVYSSSNGGHSAANEDVWQGSPRAYLRALPDPFDAESPQHRWTITADASRVHRALSSYGRVDRVYAERSASGHLRRVRLEPSGRTITGPQFRRAINRSLGGRTLLSTNLEVRRSGDRYVFEGGGFGHGVGMSQYGAHGRARAGHTVEAILAHYFPGTTLGLVEGGAAQPLVASGTYRTRPIPRAEARQMARDSSASVSASGGGVTRVVAPERRPPWVVREAVPNEGRVRSRPTPRHVAREAQTAPREDRRTGW
ncbi:MAG: SpoIID/LytB domain-containing protein [Bacteroidota bacterium]